jgi:hypothetical protein
MSGDRPQAVNPSAGRWDNRATVIMTTIAPQGRRCVVRIFVKF